MSTTHANPHVIGTYSHDRPGPLFIVITTLHGNEPAGEKAVKTLLRLLDEEVEKNSAFEFSGKLVGFIANTAAKARGIRYIDTDMNRLWTTERVAFWDKESDKKLILSEEREAKALLHAIRKTVNDYKPTQIFLLDLHTTTAEGGIFTIVPPNPTAETIGLSLFAPLITGFESLLDGALMAYFNGDFEGTPCVSLTFESGQHNDPESVTNAISAMINMLRAIGCVKHEDVEDKHDERLRTRAAALPKKAQLMYRHSIAPSDNFKMRPGYLNFQKVKKKEVLADDRKGTIKAVDDALILMPLYQKQGNDGFFLVKEVE